MSVRGRSGECEGMAYADEFDGFAAIVGLLLWRLGGERGQFLVDGGAKGLVQRSESPRRWGKGKAVGPGSLPLPALAGVRSWWGSGQRRGSGHASLRVALVYREVGEVKAPSYSDERSGRRAGDHALGASRCCYSDALFAMWSFVRPRGPLMTVNGSSGLFIVRRGAIVPRRAPA